MSILQGKLANSIANKVASICEKSVESGPEVYSSLFFGYEVSLSVDEDEEV